MEFLHQPSQSDRIGDYLKDNLSRKWTHFRAAVAFVKRSGTRHLAKPLAAFVRTGHVEIIAGIDHCGTSSEGLQELLNAVSSNGRVIVFHNRLPFTFHPKIYLFESPNAADVIVGSGNLTEGGLFTNYEAALRLRLDLADPDQAAVLRSINKVLDTWADLSTGTAHVLDDLLLARLTSMGLTPSEAIATPEHRGVAGDGENAGIIRANFPFAARAIPRAPLVSKSPRVSEALPGNTGPLTTSSAPKPYPQVGNIGFTMTLQRTDVGVGQTTKGTSRRSPEIFIPLAARNSNPEFWDWPGGFEEDPQKSGKLDRRGVRMRLGGAIITVNMMTWPDKHDFRMRSERLRSAGTEGDILRMEKVSALAGYEYDVEVIRKGTRHHQVYLALCRRPVQNSKKRFGYY